MQDMIFDISPDKYSTLSEAERYLLNYIYEHLEDISTMSIVKLSENASVSTATIVRLMKKIGYDGYTSFKYTIHEKMGTSESHKELEDIDIKIKRAILKNENEVIKTIQKIGRASCRERVKISDVCICLRRKK